MICQIALGVLLLASDKSAEAQNRTVQEYFPVAEGSKWHYKSTTTRLSDKDFKLQSKLIFKMDKVEVNGAVATAQITPNIGTASETILLNAKGLFRTSGAGNKADPPVPLMRMPIKDGDSWKATWKMKVLGEITVTESAKAAFERIKVPAGEYDAIRINRRVSFVLLKKTEQEITTWYAPSVGMIKQRAVTDNDQETLLELEKYQPAK